MYSNNDTARWSFHLHWYHIRKPSPRSTKKTWLCCVTVAFVSPPANSLDPEQTYIYVVELTLDLISHKSLSAFENHHQPHL